MMSNYMALRLSMVVIELMAWSSDWSRVRWHTPVHCRMVHEVHKSGADVEMEMKSMGLAWLGRVVGWASGSNTLVG